MIRQLLQEVRGAQCFHRSPLVHLEMAIDLGNLLGFNNTENSFHVKARYDQFNAEFFYR
jgi:hypothetical protein